MTRLLSPAANREQRRTRVAERLLAGLSIRQVASEIGSSKATVQRDASHIREQWREEYLTDADEHIRQDLKRIDTALSAIWDGVQDGKYGAIDRMIKLLDQRAKYLGLYAPERIQGELAITYLDQVREEDAVITEYAEIIEDVIRENTESGTETAVAQKALPMGARQD
jgi:hypothetical protein